MLLRTPSDLNRFLEERGDRACVLVPTMGGLHEGHLTLVRLAAAVARERGLAGGAVATVFVNPTQFDQPSDYERYPRGLDDDAALCARAGATAVYAPSAEDVYPPDGSVRVPPIPEVARLPRLEDEHRPGHMEGVCQVVKRLFELVRPAAAVFGEKDWQQLQTVQALVAQEGLGVEIIPAPLIREPDGLAMSSRNRFLTPEQRTVAREVSGALRAGRRETTPGGTERAMREHLAAHGLGIDYAVVRDAETLMPLGEDWAHRPKRALITARLGSVRLLDNAPWPDA